MKRIGNYSQSINYHYFSRDDVVRLLLEEIYYITKHAVRYIRNIFKKLQEIFKNELIS